MSDLERGVVEIASRQHGAFTRTQASGAGASRSAIHHRIRTDRWVVAAPGVLVLSGSEDNQAQQLTVALLSLGPTGVASHQSAGRLGRLDAMPPGRAVTVPHFDHRRRKGVTVHQQRLHQADLTVIDGFPVTTVPRTVCDLAMIISLARLRHVVETAHLDRLCTITSIGTTLLRVGTIGRPGSERLVTVLDDLGPGEPVGRTVLEAKLDDILDRSGLPNGVPQHPLPGVGRRSGLVDRAFPEAKLIIEADGRRWHARNAAMSTDRQRDFEAGRLGWFTVRITHNQLVDDPDDTAMGISEIYEGRARDECLTPL
jgi:hypothetical protein